MIKPAINSTKEFGSGVGTVLGMTFTLPLRVLASIELRFESNKNTLEKSMLLIPGARPNNVRIANVPLPSTPGIAPTSESAVGAMVPSTLSMVPGRKNVAPPPVRNEPSVMETADAVPGSKLKSNWKA